MIRLRPSAASYLRPITVAVFALVTVRLAVPPVIVGLPFGWDAPVYTEAARAWLEGGNPWAAHGYAFPFAGPPPSLLPFVPFIVLPAGATSAAWVGIAAASAVYALRRLQLPLWWLLFPPVSLGIMAGSSALLVTALLVRGGVLADGAAVLTRVYAAIPLVLRRRWRSLIVAAGMLAVTLPMWPQWLAERERWAAAFAGVEGLSATSVPLLIPFALVGLAVMGSERAAWLAVPVLWPDTQLYYAVIALPALVRSPFVTLSLAIPVPGLVVWGMLGQALSEGWRPWRRSSWATDLRRVHRSIKT
ncbi:MAG: hypothetical protein WEG56_11030 [Chloroflexota bacterium]